VNLAAKMASAKNDPEKTEDVESGTIRTESTIYSSDTEHAERKKEEATSEIDLEHEEVEQMDRGHVYDLDIQHVSAPQISQINPNTDPSRPLWHPSKLAVGSLQTGAVLNE
jgi:hypothetical protein